MPVIRFVNRRVQLVVRPKPRTNHWASRKTQDKPHTSHETRHGWSSSEVKKSNGKARFLGRFLAKEGRPLGDGSCKRVCVGEV